MVRKDSRIDTKIKRMDLILEQLQRGNNLSVNDIYTKLFKESVCRRTCERDIDHLRDMYGDKILRGEGSKYYWTGEVAVKPFYMDRHEFWLVYMSVLEFNTYGIDEELKLELIERLEGLIISKEVELFKKVKRNILFKRKGIIIYENESLINMFIKLIEHFYEKNILLLKYRNKYGNINERKIEIYGFCRAKDSYYIIAKQGSFISVFRMDRIIGFYEIDEKYEISEEFNLQDYLKDSFEIEVAENLIEFKLEVFGGAKNNILERKWFENQKVEFVDGKIFFEGKTISGRELKKWILGFGAGVKVIEPEFLKNEILEEYKKAIEIY